MWWFSTFDCIRITQKVCQNTDYCNSSWIFWFSRTGIGPEDLHLSQDLRWCCCFEEGYRKGKNLTDQLRHPLFLTDAASEAHIRSQHPSWGQKQSLWLQVTWAILVVHTQIASTASVLCSFSECHTPPPYTLLLSIPVSGKIVKDIDVGKKNSLGALSLYPSSLSLLFNVFQLFYDSKNCGKL